MRCFVRPAIFLPTALAALVCTPSAYAQVFTISDSATVASRPTSFNQSVNLSRFNTDLGTLVGIQVILDANAVASLEVENRTPNASGEVDRTLNSFSLRVPVRVTGPSSLSLTVNTTADSTQFADFTAPKTFTPGEKQTYTGPTSTASGTANIPLSGFASYQGSGAQTVQLLLNGRAALLSEVDGDTGLTYTPRASAGATVRIVYSYTANSSATIPEPGALGLLATGFAPVALGLVRRRK